MKVLSRHARQSRVQLHRSLVAHFSLDELHTLAFEIGLEWDDLPGETRAAKARALIEICERNALMRRLRRQIRLDRPNMTLWSRRGTPSRRTVPKCAGFSGQLRPNAVSTVSDL